MKKKKTENKEVYNKQLKEMEIIKKNMKDNTSKENLKLKKNKIDSGIIQLFKNHMKDPVVKEKTVVSYIEYCSKGEFDKIISLYDADLATFISPEEVKGIWNATQNKSGKFVAIKEMKTSKDGQFDISTVLCQFEKETCQFTFIFDEAGNLKSVVKSYCSK